MTQITYNQVRTIEAWKENTIEAIRYSVDSVNAGTTVDEDEMIALSVFDRLLEKEMLRLPDDPDEAFHKSLGVDL